MHNIGLSVKLSSQDGIFVGPKYINVFQVVKMSNMCARCDASAALDNYD